MAVVNGAYNGRVELPAGFEDLWLDVYAAECRGKWSTLVAAALGRGAVIQQSLEVEIGQRRLMQEARIRHGLGLADALAELVELGIVEIRPAGERKRTAYRLVLLDAAEIALRRTERRQTSNCPLHQRADLPPTPEGTTGPDVGLNLSQGLLLAEDPRATRTAARGRRASRFAVSDQARSSRATNSPGPVNDHVGWVGDY